MQERSSQQSVIDMYEEARSYFVGEGTLNKTLDRLSKDLDEHGIDYMVNKFDPYVRTKYLELEEAVRKSK